MLVIDAIYDVRNKINDRDEIGLDDEELLSYLNEALQYVSSYLVSANSPLMVKEVIISDDKYQMPDDFIRFVGTLPIKTTGTEVTLLDEPPLKARYFASVSSVGINDDMPFKQTALNQVAIKLAGIYAQNQQGLNVQQDKALLDELNASIAAAISGAK